VKFFDFHPPWYIPLALFLVALLVGILKVRSLWEEIHEDEDPASERERLSELEEAHAAGELDEEELRRVRDLLSRSESSHAPEPLRRRTPIQPDPPPSAGSESSSSDESPVQPDSP
jgi:hypothetical protein